MPHQGADNGRKAVGRPAFADTAAPGMHRDDVFAVWVDPIGPEPLRSRSAIVFCRCQPALRKLLCRKKALDCVSEALCGMLVGVFSKSGRADNDPRDAQGLQRRPNGVFLLCGPDHNQPELPKEFDDGRPHAIRAAN
jgi:hypothetical protein